MKFGIVSRMAESMFPYHGWPTVCRDDDGVLYVGASAFRLGHLCAYGKNVLFLSRDGGESWSCPRVINDDALDDRDVGLCSLGKKKILATWFAHPYEHYKLERMQKWINDAHPSVRNIARDMIEGWSLLSPERVDYDGAFCKVSEDGGETWSERRVTPVTSPHGPTMLRSGKLFYLGKERGNGVIHGDGAIKAYESEDEGRTWKYLSTVKFPECCGEIRHLAMEDDRA